MNRNYDIFPKDETGDALWEMRENGDVQSTPREFDFSVIFPTEDEALEFGFFLLANKQKVSFCEYDDDPENPWEITVHPYMAAQYDMISGFEALLQEHAEKYNGTIDGWGCLEQGEEEQ